MMPQPENGSQPYDVLRAETIATWFAVENSSSCGKPNGDERLEDAQPSDTVDINTSITRSFQTSIMLCGHILPGTCKC
jgi:hypothetical protein